MSFKAKLVKGETYHINNAVFKKDVEVEVDKDLAEYLQNNAQFEVTEEKSAQKKASAPAPAKKSDEK